LTYLLDTNIVSALMKADPLVENWISRLGPNDQLEICTIVRGEILYGISRLPSGKRRTELEQSGRPILDLLHCLPVPSEAAGHYATLKRQRQSAGLSLDENDLWIAATAMALNATLVTHDRDLHGIPALSVHSPR
jgi:predicted nucleic acid-binding protein